MHGRRDEHPEAKLLEGHETMFGRSRLLLSRRALGASAASAGALFSLYDPPSALCNAAPAAGYAAPKIVKGATMRFDEWKTTLRQQFGAEKDHDAELREFVGIRKDAHFLWQTLRNDRCVKNVAIWKCTLPPRLIFFKLDSHDRYSTLSRARNMQFPTSPPQLARAWRALPPWLKWATR